MSEDQVWGIDIASRSPYDDESAMWRQVELEAQEMEECCYE